MYHILDIGVYQAPVHVLETQTNMLFQVTRPPTSHHPKGEKKMGQASIRIQNHRY